MCHIPFFLPPLNYLEVKEHSEGNSAICFRPAHLLISFGTQHTNTGKSDLITQEDIGHRSTKNFFCKGSIFTALEREKMGDVLFEFSFLSVVYNKAHINLERH